MGDNNESGNKLVVLQESCGCILTVALAILIIPAFPPSNWIEISPVDQSRFQIIYWEEWGYIVDVGTMRGEIWTGWGGGRVCFGDHRQGEAGFGSPASSERHRKENIDCQSCQYILSSSWLKIGGRGSEIREWIGLVIEC